MSLAEAPKQGVWLKHFLWSINKPGCVRGLERATIMYEDNQGAIALTDNPNDHPRTKHIAIRYHAIRDLIQSGEVKLQYLPTYEMLADALTKVMEKTLMAKLTKAIGMSDG